jgi:hypothetical protein
MTEFYERKSILLRLGEGHQSITYIVGVGGREWRISKITRTEDDLMMQ